MNSRRGTSTRLDAGCNLGRPLDVRSCRRRPGPPQIGATDPRRHGLAWQQTNGHSLAGWCSSCSPAGRSGAP